MNAVSKWSRLALVAAVVVSLGLLTGCAKDKKQINADYTEDTTASADTHMTGTGQPDVDLEGLLWGPSGLEAVYFDFDSYSLRPDARAALQRNADKVKQAPGAMIQIEGHCDERGTQEYNLALGEKRALATREYLIQLGVPSSQLVTISYGEEDPANPASNEAAWAQNRRCEFNKAQR